MNAKEILKNVKVLLGMEQKPEQEEVILEEVSTDVFTSQEEATKRAEELGCELTHTLELEDGTVGYMPCESHEQYEDKVASQEEVEMQEEVALEVTEETEEEVQEDVTLSEEESKEDVQTQEVDLEEEEVIEEEEKDYQALYEEAIKEVEELKQELEAYTKADEELQIELSEEVEEITHSPEVEVSNRPLSNVQLRDRHMTTQQRVMTMISQIKK